MVTLYGNNALRCRVCVRTAVDVAITERRRAFLLDGRGSGLLFFLSLRALLHTGLLAAGLLGLCRAGTARDSLFVQLLAILVDDRAVGCIPHVVPHRGAVGSRGCSVDVVSQELGREVVLARASGVTRLTSVNLRKPPDRSGCFVVGVQHHTDQLTLTVVTGTFSTLAERGREGVVDEPCVCPVRRDGRCRIVAAVAGSLDIAHRLPVASART